eukprot:CAMPEP_0118862482 /NCGR_PEP_ID=MMETSP1163-20130328/7673_1 /TAXON_ID=124430 /ORGANISM="Phaeomonas parva, Strain CCMP2877" /LENGTH=185 /DNA_ID=CAMNT_0006796395 /DNA_START=285 /DNA_END=839 /DNA_ORIENTATION=-
MAAAKALLSAAQEALLRHAGDSEADAVVEKMLCLWAQEELELGPYPNLDDEPALSPSANAIGNGNLSPSPISSNPNLNLSMNGMDDADAAAVMSPNPKKRPRAAFQSFGHRRRQLIYDKLWAAARDVDSEASDEEEFTFTLYREDEDVIGGARKRPKAPPKATAAKAGAAVSAAKSSGAGVASQG